MDRLGRPLRDLRISVTDRCNFRCVYCMPKEVFGRDYQFLPRAQLLDYEEIARLARAFVANGVTQAPHHRRRAARAPARRAPRGDAGCARRRADADDERDAPAAEGAGARRRRALARDREPRLAGRRDVPRDERRGLPRRARAGRHRRRGGRRPAGQGQRGREARPQRRTASSTWRATSEAPATSSASSSTWTSATRTAGAWTTSCRPARSSTGSAREFPLEPVEPSYRGEVATRWRYLDGAGEIGVIASVTQPFCGDCTRARLSAEGQLYTCLFAVRGHDLRALVRSGATDAELDAAIASIWAAAPTATRSFARRTPSTCRRSRCPTSAADCGQRLDDGCASSGRRRGRASCGTGCRRTDTRTSSSEAPTSSRTRPKHRGPARPAREPACRSTRSVLRCRSATRCWISCDRSCHRRRHLVEGGARRRVGVPVGEPGEATADPAVEVRASLLSTELSTNPAGSERRAVKAWNSARTFVHSAGRPAADLDGSPRDRARDAAEQRLDPAARADAADSRQPPVPDERPLERPVEQILPLSRLRDRGLAGEAQVPGFLADGSEQLPFSLGVALADLKRECRRTAPGRVRRSTHAPPVAVVARGHAVDRNRELAGAAVVDQEGRANALGRTDVAAEPRVPAAVHTEPCDVRASRVRNGRTLAVATAAAGEHAGDDKREQDSLRRHVKRA